MNYAIFGIQKTSALITMYRNHLNCPDLYNEFFFFFKENLNKYTLKNYLFESNICLNYLSDVEMFTIIIYWSFEKRFAKSNEIIIILEV